MASYQGNLNHLLKLCREKESFSEVDEVVLLTAYLQYASRMLDARPLVHRMMKEVGSLQALVHIPAYRLKEYFNLTDVQATAIALLGAISDHEEIHQASQQPLKTLEQFYHCIKPYFASYNYEKTLIICLNRYYRLIAIEMFTFYDPHQTASNAALVLEMARKHQAVHVVLAHNHPTVSACMLMPSAEDWQATLQIKRKLDAYNIHLEDHILMAYDGCASILYPEQLYFDPIYLKKLT